MHLGILQFDLLMLEAESLKDKRRAVRAVRDRLHREHLVAVAEVGSLDNHAVARIGLAAVSNDGKYLSDLLDRILAKLRALPGGDWGAAAGACELGDVSKQIVGADDLADTGTTGEPDSGPLWTPDERRDDA
ncbi:MAG: DUF503 family protein [Phycisphaerales bacterium]